MKNIIASAPGKAVVAGEYAVLGGAPAVSMALNRRASVHVRESRENSHSLNTPGFLPGTFRFRSTRDFQVQWLDEIPTPDSFALFEAVWKRAGSAPANNLALTLDTREFFDSSGGSKLGLGSSAALATALSAALIETQSLSCTIDTLAGDSHRDFQGGAGSGIDVATAIHGGVIGYRIGQPVEPLRWPRDLAYCVLWSGHGVSTVGKIARLADKVEHRSLKMLHAASQHIFDRWMTSDAMSLLPLLRSYTATLMEFSEQYALNIFGGGHQELVNAAANFDNIVYKPCGAGGGDIGIVLAKSQKVVDLFVASAVKSGFLPLDVSLDTVGAVVEDNHSC